MNPIIEKVARALCEGAGELPDTATPHNPHAAFVWQHYSKDARAAIRATLRHYAENPSVGMLAAAIPLADGDPPADAKRLAAGALLRLSGGRDIKNEGDVVPHAAQIVVDFRSMLNQAIAEIDG